jgi:hypothetical protein
VKRVKRKNKLKNCGNKEIRREKRIDKRENYDYYELLDAFRFGSKRERGFKVKIKCRNGTVI